MSQRFIELVVRARRLVAGRPARRTPPKAGAASVPAARSRVRELQQFSFRLAVLVDVTCITLGAAGGVAVARATTALSDDIAPPAGCVADPSPPDARTLEASLTASRR